MIDYVRLEIRDASAIRYLFENLNFSTPRDKKNNRTTNHYDFKIGEFIWVTFIEGESIKLIIVEGSLHKYFHGNNYCDFYFSEILEAINRLCLVDLLNIEPELLYITRIEIGVNLYNVIESKLFINSILNHRGKPVNRIKTKSKSKGIIVCCTEQEVKVYDKALQYEISDTEILRIERKTYNRKSYTSIATLKDLYFKYKVQKLFYDFIECYKDFLFTDFSIELTKLSKSEKRAFEIGNNPLVWVLEDKSSKEKEVIKKRKRVFKDIIGMYGCDMQNKIQNEIEKTGQKLFEDKENFPLIHRGV